MSNDRNTPFKKQLLNEIWDEIEALDGKELDNLLKDIGLNPDHLLEHYAKGVEVAGNAARRERFEEAKRHVRAQVQQFTTKIVNMELAKKQQIFVAVRERTTNSNDMTIAARNRKIDAEQDLDSFLEACVRLGVIDEEGNLKD